MFFHHSSRLLPVVTAAVLLSSTMTTPAIATPAVENNTITGELQSSAAAQQAYCETSDDLTFGGVFNLVVDSLSDTVSDSPEERKQFDDNARKYGALIGNMPISRIAVVNPSSQIGGPSREVDDHAVNFVVSTIMKGKNNGWNDTVQVKNITLNEAIESALTLLYFGSIPVELWGKVMPDVLSVSFLHIFSVSPLTVPKLTAQYAPKVLMLMGDFVQKQLEINCLSTVPSGSTPHAYNHNPKPARNPDSFLAQQGNDIQQVVDSLNVASETCRPLAEYTLREISDEVFALLREQVRPEFQHLYDLATTVYMKQLDFVRINTGTIPIRGKDVGGLIGLIDDPTLTYAFTTATSLFDGRVTRSIPLGDVTIDNTMDTYTLVTDISEKVTSIMWDLVVNKVGNFIPNKIAGEIPGLSDVACLPANAIVPEVGPAICGIIWDVVGLPSRDVDVVPNVIPLVFFYPDYIHPVVHGVVRSVCLTRDEGQPARWHRSTDMIENDAKLAENKGTYTRPDDTVITVPVTGWKVSNPFFREKKWKKYEQDVPQRPRVFDSPTVA